MLPRAVEYSRIVPATIVYTAVNLISEDTKRILTHPIPKTTPNTQSNHVDAIVDPRSAGTIFTVPKTKITVIKSNRYPVSFTQRGGRSDSALDSTLICKSGSEAGSETLAIDVRFGVNECKEMCAHLCERVVVFLPAFFHLQSALTMSLL
jgi:hypothetical protein